MMYEISKIGLVGMNYAMWINFINQINDEKWRLIFTIIGLIFVNMFIVSQATK